MAVQWWTREERKREEGRSEREEGRDTRREREERGKELNRPWCLAVQWQAREERETEKRERTERERELDGPSQFNQFVAVVSVGLFSAGPWTKDRERDGKIQGERGRQGGWPS